MVSNRMNAHKEMRYWPLLCGSAEDGSYYKQEVPEQLARPASQQRKDTKDSGIGECVSECEEQDVQHHLPDWCRKCLEINSDKNIVHKGNSDEDDDSEGDKVTIEKSSIDDDGNVTDDGNTSKDRVRFGEADYYKPNDDNGKDSWTCRQDEVSQIGNMRGRRQKSCQRQRRITPVPLSNPVKLTLRSSPDCLFVEEEDTDDIQLFNLEEEFVDQGFWQLTPSPRGSPRLGHKYLNGSKAAEPYKMEGSKVQANEDFALSRSLSEMTGLKLSPEPTRTNRQEVRGKQARCIGDDNKSLGRTMQCHRLYMRSQSEADAYVAPGGMSRGFGWVGVNAIKCNFEKSKLEEEENTTEPLRKGGDSNMTSKDVPHIELEQAAAPLLPDWMREAKVEKDAVPRRSNQSLADDRDCGSKAQENSCVKLRRDGAPTYRSSQSLLDRTGITEDIIKIYTPQKHYESKTPKRNRKLTPARAASPSLEKLADLQSQFYDLSLAEQDSD